MNTLQKILFLLLALSCASVHAGCRTNKITFKNGTGYPIDLCFTKYFGPKNVKRIYVAKWESKELVLENGEVRMAEPTWRKWNMAKGAKKKTEKRSYKVEGCKKLIIYDTIFSGLKMKRKR